MFVFLLAASLYFCTSIQICCADGEQSLAVTTPHYILQSKRSNFADIFVSKKAFDNVLQGKKNQILGFVDHTFKDHAFEIGAIEFVCENYYATNDGDNTKKIIIDITHIVYGGGSRNPYFKTRDEAFMYLDQKSYKQYISLMHLFFIQKTYLKK